MDSKSLVKNRLSKLLVKMVLIWASSLHQKKEKKNLRIWNDETGVQNDHEARSHLLPWTSNQINKYLRKSDHICERD